MKEILLKIIRHNVFKFLYVSAIYSLWVLWMDNYWFFAAIPIIFDIFITKYVRWAFWHFKNPNTTWKKLVNEYSDALLIALFLANFIRIFLFEAFLIPTPSMERTLRTGDFVIMSKIHYGPRMPQTILTMPFTHNTFPDTQVKSYLNWIQLPYKRLKGFSSVKRNDVVVFNFPVGDSVVLQHNTETYYSLIRQYGKEFVKKNFNVVGHPVDKRENYIKRCIGLPGDEIEIRSGVVFINGVENEKIKGLQHNYYVKTRGERLPPDFFEKLGISRDDRNYNASTSMYEIPLTEANVEKIQTFDQVIGLRKYESLEGSVFNYSIFPYSFNRLWTEDNFGPLKIPKKGDTTSISIYNLPLFERIINVYENNDLQVVEDEIYINGELANKYVFKMNYYFVLGDSRHNSSDSRYWGFVPEDHIAGKAIFVWLSLDRDKSKFKKIRWKNMFKTIK